MDVDLISVDNRRVIKLSVVFKSYIQFILRLWDGTQVTSYFKVEWKYMFHVWADAFSSAFLQAGTRLVPGPVTASSGAAVPLKLGVVLVNQTSFSSLTFFPHWGFSVFPSPHSCKTIFWWDMGEGCAMSSSYIPFCRTARNPSETELQCLKMFLVALGFAQIFVARQLMDKIMLIKSDSHAQNLSRDLKCEIFSVAEGNVRRSSQHFSRDHCHCPIAQTVNLGQGKMKRFAQGQPAAELRANWAFMSPCSVFCPLPALLLVFHYFSFSITPFLKLSGCSFGFALLTASMICRSASAENPLGGGKEWVDQALGRKRNPNKSLPSHHPTPKINTTPRIFMLQHLWW